MLTSVQSAVAKLFNGVASCMVHCEVLNTLTLKHYLFWWNQVSKVYEWKKLGMESMLLIKFGQKMRVKNFTDTLKRKGHLLHQMHHWMHHFSKILVQLLTCWTCLLVFTITLSLRDGEDKVQTGEYSRTCFHITNFHSNVFNQNKSTKANQT